jgi:hypothetical protein
LFITPSARLFERLDDTGLADDGMLVGTLADVDTAPALQ